ncbi:hypothetical protein AB0P17_28955 [Streptomyces sp. NPDC088124]|uniref:hypothetical protein n=1 Tax=Streptomyces sp. NPDC088124 TaxID=3154654 RepID=UPI00341323D5
MLYDAEQTLVQQCMRERGFRVWPVPRQPIADDRRFPYAVDDAGWAAKHGYGSDIQRRVEKLRATDPNRLYYANLPPERRKAATAALNGTSPDGLSARLPGGGEVTASTEGCTAWAQSALYTDLAAWFEADVVTGQLPAMAQNQVRADPAYRKSVGAWAACMRERGYAYKNPDDSRAQFLSTEKKSGDTSRNREIRSAVDEAACADDSGLSATADRLERKYGAALRVKYRSAVRSRLRLEHAALPRARETTR